MLGGKLDSYLRWKLEVARVRDDGGHAGRIRALQ